jgi:hypothetical protein
MAFASSTPSPSSTTYWAPWKPAKRSRPRACAPCAPGEERRDDLNAAKLNREVEHTLESLRREFAEEIPADQVTAVGEACFEALRADARIPDFIPVLVYRHAREELIRAGRGELHHAA